MLAVPMLREGVAIGVIDGRRAEARPFQRQGDRPAQTFADQAVIAIENVRLFNETKEALERQTATADILRVISESPTDVTPVFDAIAERARVLCGARLGFTTRFDGERLQLIGYCGVSAEAEARMRAAFPVLPSPNTLNGRCFLAEAPVQIDDMQQDPDYALGSVAKTGITAAAWRCRSCKRARPSASIGVGREQAGAFPPELVSLLQTFADQAAIAIQNALLFNETQEALQRQTATSEILQVISGSPTDVQPVLQAVAERAAKICDAQFVDIILREGETIRGVAVFGDLGGRHRRSDAAGPQHRHGPPIVDRQPVHVHDLQQAQDEYPRGSELARQHGHHTTLAMPLLRDGRALGSILVRRTEVQPFDDKHIALLRTFADQAAIAIENVRLFNETQGGAGAADRQRRGAGASSAARWPTPYRFSRRSCESCERLFDCTNVSMLLVDDDALLHFECRAAASPRPKRLAQLLAPTGQDDDHRARRSAAARCCTIPTS